MSLAMKRLKNLGWLALVFMVAILLYPLSLNVAALHSDLVAVDRHILIRNAKSAFCKPNCARARVCSSSKNGTICFMAISRRPRSNSSTAKRHWPV